MPDGPWDAITVVDVLYLLPAVAQRDLLERAAARLRRRAAPREGDGPGAPVEGARWNTAQETLAVKVVGFTASESTGFTFVPPSETASWLTAYGLTVSGRAAGPGVPPPASPAGGGEARSREFG